MRNNVLLLLVLHVVSLNAQFFDSFNDGDFVANPKWLGNNTLFTVDPQNKLRLNAPAGGVAYLYTQLVYPDSFTAVFDLNLEFSPSASNFARVYFMCQSANPAEGKAYFIQAGENGSADALRLYSSENGKTTLLASGREGAFSTDPAAARVKIVYNKGGTFACYADYDYNGSYEDAFGVTDSRLLPESASFFGVECTFTTSRKDKFVFDNLGVAGLVADTMAPSIRSAAIKDENHIEVVFDEPVSAASALNPENYVLATSFHPNTVNFNGSEDRVVLFYANGFPNEDTLLLRVSAISDPSGNTLSNYELKLTFTRRPRVGELVLSEILFDPYVNHSDFIEVYNASSSALSIDSLRVSNVLNGQMVTINDRQPLLPGRFRAYTPNSAQLAETYNVDFNAEVFQQALPAFNNDKGSVQLISSKGVLLDSFTYSDKMHTLDVTSKNTEGVSLEKAVLVPFLNNANNWISGDASTSYASPGYANAVSFDRQPPSISGIETLGKRQIKLMADDLISAVTMAGFEVMTTSNMPIALGTVTVDKKQILLSLLSDLEASLAYKIKITGLKDKNQNGMRDTLLFFEYGDVPVQGDLVLSEVLFNPNSPVSDFVELYNATTKNIQLRGLSITNADNGQTDSVGSHFVLAAGRYVAISKDTLSLKLAYPIPSSALFLQNDLPALNADYGIVMIYNHAGELLDSFSYDEERHHVLIDKEDRKGISLEKIGLKPFENGRFSWASASQAGGYASPGYQNSNFFSGSMGSEAFFLPKKVFSPNQDGQDDLLMLQYALDKPGYIAQLSIYSSDGYKVKNLTNNELLGQTGFLSWDGTNDLGKPEMLGIYIITGSLFHPDGQVIRIKKDCVLADFID